MASDREVGEQLSRFVRAHVGEDATATALTALPGHAGLSYSFELASGGSSIRRERLVLRLAPEGVRPIGTADVVRQARIMRSLADTRVPVPPVRWLGDDPQWFGRPYFVTAFIASDKLALGERQYTEAQQRRFEKSVAATLAALHQVEWEPRRETWGDPFTLTQEMERLDHLLDRPTLIPATIVGAAKLRERLRSTLPENPRVGCVHGDYQWANTLIGDDRVVIVIDWELAQIGATLIDLGWLLLFSDRDSWVVQNLLPEHTIVPEELAAEYNESVPWRVTAPEIRWFRAFAGYRFGVITAFNLMLHRRGKRHDPTWEEIALSAPRLFERGLELIG
jgi:aminoglycoside phosphotransferase (APT) family kinase protein